MDSNSPAETVLFFNREENSVLHSQIHDA